MKPKMMMMMGLCSSFEACSHPIRKTFANSLLSEQTILDRQLYTFMVCKRQMKCLISDDAGYMVFCLIVPSMEVLLLGVSC